MRKESIQIAERMIRQGATSEDIWRAFSTIDPEARDMFWRIPRNNITHFIESSVERFKIEDPIVDVGCGSRSHFSTVSRILGRDPEYYAFDHYYRISADRPTDAPNIVASAAAIPIVDDAARTVICTEVLEHVPDDISVLNEMKRIMHPEGILLLSVPGRHIPKHEKLPFQVDYRRYSEQELVETLDTIGFLGITVTEGTIEGLQTNIFAIAQGKYE